MWSPVSTTSRTVQSRLASAPGRRGQPVAPVLQSSPSKRIASRFLSANRLESVVCSRPSTFTVNVREAWISLFVFEALSAQTRISGGFRLTDVKAETVMPRRSAPCCEVTIVTPLGQLPSDRLNVSASTGMRSLHLDADGRAEADPARAP